ncbi:MAG: ABC transporter permease subunit [Candidatus Hodarchaeales archaeon]|jgi:simple sugar transport system permease protein
MLETSSLEDEIEGIKTSKISEIIKQLFIPLCSIFMAFILSGIIFLLMDIDPLKAYEKMFDMLTTDKQLANVLFFSTPLILTGLSVAVAFRAGMFNIGTEGQMVMGGFMAALVGFGLHDYFGIDLPPLIFIPLLMLAGFFGGAAWALIPAILKARGVHEVITTILMNSVAGALMVFLVGGQNSPFIAAVGTNIASQTPNIPESARLPLVFERAFSQLHWGFFLGILVCVLVYVLLWKTKLGYETRTVGFNPDAAKYGGIHVKRSLIITMLISGGIGGLAGAFEVMGQFFMYQDKSLAGLGFDGIAVSIIGGNHPFGVIFGAILFGWLQTTGIILQVNQIPKDVANTLKGIIVLLVAVPMIAKTILDYIGKRYQNSWLSNEVEIFSQRYNARKGNLKGYFQRIEDNDGKKVFFYIISLLFWPIILILLSYIFTERPFDLILFPILIILLGIFLLFLADFSLSIFFSQILGPELGGLIANVDGLILILGTLLFLVYAIFIRYSLHSKQPFSQIQSILVFFLELNNLLLRSIHITVKRIGKWIFSYRVPSYLISIARFVINHIDEIASGLLIISTLIVYSVISSDLDNSLLIVISSLLLAVVILAYIIMKKRDLNRNTQALLLVSGIWVGFIEYFNLVALLGQDTSLFLIIVALSVFFIINEYLAYKQGIKQWLKNFQNTKRTSENKQIVQSYSLLMLILLALLILMFFIGRKHLPYRFNLIIFSLYNFGALFGIIGIFSIFLGLLYFRRISFPQHQNEVYYIPYLLFSVVIIFISYSFATFFRPDAFVLFAALFGLLTLMIIGLMINEWIKWQKYVFSTHRSNPNGNILTYSDTPEKFFLLFCFLVVLLGFLTSYSHIYIGILFLPIIVYVLILLSGLLFFIYKWFSWKKTEIHKQKIGTDPQSSFVRNRSIRLYLYFCTVLIILSILITFIGRIRFPIKLAIFPTIPSPLGDIKLFLFELDRMGEMFGILGVTFLILGFLITSKSLNPANSGEIYYLPQIFTLLSMFFIFQTITTLLGMDPYLTISLTLVIATPIGFAALGGMYSEKSGVVNIGLEGMMLTGAFTAVWISFETGNAWLGVIGAIIAGAFMGLLHAIASIRFRANQVVVGIAINILASAVTTLGIVLVWNKEGTSDVPRILKNVKFTFLKDIPIFGELLYNLTNADVGLSPLIYLFFIIVILSAWIIQRTNLGLRIRAVGEYPRAADTLGINVYRTRYIAVIVSGLLAALGGAQLTLGWATVFTKDMTTGRGFVALAALIFGGWHPIGAALASLFFGFAYAFRFQLDVMGIASNWRIFDLHLDSLTPIIPFVITIIAVAIVAKRMRPPAADGIPYVKEGD